MTESIPQLVSGESALEIARLTVEKIYPIHGWLYVGAGDGEKIARTIGSNVPRVLAIEANKEYFERLVKNISGKKNWSAHQGVISEKNESVDFYVHFNANESGLISTEKLAPLWKSLRLKDKIQTKATNLSTFLDTQSHHDSYNWLTLDCFPAEKLLRGSGRYLENFDVIMCRLPIEAGVLNGLGASLQECENLLNPNGFKSIYFAEEVNSKIGLVVYVKDWKISLEKQKKSSLTDFEARLGQLSKEHLQLLEVERGKLGLAIEHNRQAEISFEKIINILNQENSVLRINNEKNISFKNSLETSNEKLRISVEEKINSGSLLEKKIESLLDENNQLRLTCEKNINLEKSLDTVKEKLKSATEDKKNAQLALQNKIEILTKENAGLRLVNKELVVQNNDLKKYDKNHKQVIDGISLLKKNLEKFVRKEIANGARQIGDFVNLEKFFQTGIFPDIGLEINGWPASSDFMLLLAKLIKKNKYDLVVEFGSGTSTLVIAKSISCLGKIDDYGKTEFISFDHLAEYFEETRDRIYSSGLNHFVKLFHAPLIDYMAPDGQMYKYYDCFEILTEEKKLLKSCQRILLVVDGPPAATGKNARYPALPIVEKIFGCENIDVLLDDASREDEKEVGEKWKKILIDAKYSVSEKTINLEKGADLLKAKKL